MRYFLVFSAALIGFSSLFQLASAQNYNTTGITMPGVEAYDSDARQTDNDDDRYNRDLAEQSPADNTTYKMDENGFLVPVTGPAAEAAEKPGAGAPKKVNNPNKQVYKGGQKKPLVAPRTHRMYEDTRY